MSFNHLGLPVIFIAQLFGVLPVGGILSSNVRNVKFRWLRVRVLLSGIVIVGASLELCLSIANFSGVDVSLNVGMIAFLIYAGSILLGQLYFVRLATGWPRLIRRWLRSEAVFLRPPYMQMRGDDSSYSCGRRFGIRNSAGLSLCWRLRLVCFGMMSCACIEHLLYIAATVNGAIRHMDECLANGTLAENIIRRERPHMLWLLRAAGPWSLLPLEYLNVAMTFCWSFIDVWIMAVSVGLTVRFRQLGARLEVVRGKLMADSFWIEVRTQYLVLVDLLQRVDEQMSAVVLLSCANNMFFVCHQLFNSFV